MFHGPLAGFHQRRRFSSKRGQHLIDTSRHRNGVRIDDQKTAFRLNLIEQVINRFAKTDVTAGPAGRPIRDTAQIPAAISDGSGREQTIRIFVMQRVQMQRNRTFLRRQRGQQMRLDKF